jgi:peptidoglycan/LPS O-acetylase OafA/YrhL
VGEPRARIAFQPGLEGLRGVAVVMVMWAHVGEFLAHRDAWWLLPGGFLGVDVFFVLSGFLITTLLEQERIRTGAVALSAFWRRRIARLTPALYVFLFVHVLFVVFVGDPLRLELKSVAFAGVYLANYQLSVGSHPPFDLVHLWTLSMEMQFYVIWPIVLVRLRRRLSTRWLLGGLAIAVVAIATIRWVEWRAWDDWTLVYERTDARADALLVGALLALVWPSIAPSITARRLAGAWCALAGTAVITLLAFTQRPGAGFLFGAGFTVGDVAVALVIVGALVPSRARSVLAWAPLRAVGRASYSLYLWHLPVFVAVTRWGDTWPLAFQVVVVFAITAALGTASFVVVERRTLRSRRAASRADEQHGTVGDGEVPGVAPVVSGEDDRHR